MTPSISILWFNILCLTSNVIQPYSITKYVQNEPIIEDLMLQQTMIQMKHQQILQQQILEVLGAENQCSLW